MCYPKFHSLVVSNNKATKSYLAVIAALALVFGSTQSERSRNPAPRSTRRRSVTDLSGGDRHGRRQYTMDKLGFKRVCVGG